MVRLVPVRGAGVPDMGNLLPLVMLLLRLLYVHGLHGDTVGQLVLHGLRTRGRAMPVGSQGHHLNRRCLHL